jgi:hypothetical protein
MPVFTVTFPNRNIRYNHQFRRQNLGKTYSGVGYLTGPAIIFNSDIHREITNHPERGPES